MTDRLKNALLNSLGDAEAIIHDLVAHESEPCAMDRHGYCQEHGHNAPCAIKRAREFLGLST